MTHRYLHLFVTVFILMTGALSCNKSSDNEGTPKFGQEITLSADSTEIDVIIKAGNIFRADPFIIVSDVAHADGMHFAVFNDSLRYLYSFCPYGSGPSDCMMPALVKNTAKNHILIRDHGNNTYHSYLLTDSSAVENYRFQVKEFSPYESLWEINQIGDNKYLLRGTTPRESVRKLVDFKEETVVDSLTPSFDLKAILGRDYYSEFDDLWMVASHNHFACAYFFIDRIEFGSIDHDRLEIHRHFGPDTPPDFRRYTDEKLSGEYEYNVDYNTVYYEWLFGSANKVYASYFGAPWGDIDRHSRIIEAYTYEGQPIAKYDLNIPVASFIVLDDNRIIGINPERSDDHFYCFDIK